MKISEIEAAAKAREAAKTPPASAAATPPASSGEVRERLARRLLLLKGYEYSGKSLVEDTSPRAREVVEWANALIKDFPALVTPERTIANDALRRAADICEDVMSRAKHAKRHADLDNHLSERCHQEGRWHAANDLREEIEALIKEPGHE